MLHQSRIWIFTFILALSPCAFSQTEWHATWIHGTTEKLYVTHTPPSQPGYPTLVFINGLTYEFNKWEAMAHILAPLGYGVIMYDPIGQGQSLLRYGAPKHPVPVETQAQDLQLITQALGVTGPLHLIGLSYGGGVAIAYAKLYPNRIANAFLLAPYTEPLESQDKWIQQQIQWVRIWQPWVTATDDDLYAEYLKLNVYNMFPLSEPSILSHPDKRQAVFQLIQGIRKFNMAHASQHFPESSVHLVIAGLDQYIPRPVLERFWTQLPPDARSTKMVIRLSEHKLPEHFPRTTASWIHQVIQNKKTLTERTQAEGSLYDSIIDPLLLDPHSTPL